jgi:hypothetical protein
VDLNQAVRKCWERKTRWTNGQRGCERRTRRTNRIKLLGNIARENPDGPSRPLSGCEGKTSVTSQMMKLSGEVVRGKLGGPKNSQDVREVPNMKLLIR